MTHRHTDTKTHIHTDTQLHRQTQIALQSITNFYLCMENQNSEKKKPYTKTLFAPDFIIALVVLKRVLETQSETGKQNKR